MKRRLFTPLISLFVLMLPLCGQASAQLEAFGRDEPTSSKVKMTKQEKAQKAAELAPTITAMLSDPQFPATAQSDLNVEVEVVVYMGGFHLSTLAFTTAFHTDGYEIRSNVQTEGLVDALVRTDAVIGARGAFEGGLIKPRLYNSDITDRNQRQLVAIAYGELETGNSPSEILSFPEYNLEKYPVSDAQKQGSVDPMSAIMQMILAASLDAEEPCGGTIPVFDGRRRFDLVLKHVGNEEISTGRGAAFEGDALKCWIGFKRVAGYKPKKKKRNARTDGLSEWPDVYMWLAPVHGGGRTVHMPVRFFAETGLGAVVARATRLKSATVPVSDDEQHATVVGN